MGFDHPGIEHDLSKVLDCIQVKHLIRMSIENDPGRDYAFNRFPVRLRSFDLSKMIPPNYKDGSLSHQ